jgi:hypothetical protein
MERGESPSGVSPDLATLSVLALNSLYLSVLPPSSFENCAIPGFFAAVAGDSDSAKHLEMVFLNLA